MKLSIIISILNSHTIVTKQLRYLRAILSNSEFNQNCELLFADDGSDPPLLPTIESVLGKSQSKSDNIIDFNPGFRFRLLVTNDFRPWTQPLARNKLALIAEGEYLFMTDIDHILTEEALKYCLHFTGDKVVFRQYTASLDEDCKIVIDNSVHRLEALRKLINFNTFLIKKTIFNDLLKGYSESTAGNYSTDTRDICTRYMKLFLDKKVKAEGLANPCIYSYKDPENNPTLFHSLKRNKE